MMKVVSYPTAQAWSLRLSRGSTLLFLGLLFYACGCLEGIDGAFAYGSLFCVTGVTTCQGTQGFQAVVSGTS